MSGLKTKFNNNLEREIQTANQTNRKRVLLSSIISNEDRVVTSDKELQEQKIKIDNFFQNKIFSWKFNNV